METKLIKNHHKEKHNVIPFSQEFNHISPMDLENIMEWLQDREYLSDKGKVFHHAYWQLFIKKNV